MKIDASSIDSASLMTRQAMVLGVGLFIVLTIVAYIIFPVLYQGQLNAIQGRLSDHVHQGAHTLADIELESLAQRVVALEASALRQDSAFKVPELFVLPDSLHK